MQRGILKHYAHVLPQIFYERMLWYEGMDGFLNANYEAFASWGGGHLTIDMIRGTCALDDADVEPIPITRELQGWLARELQRQVDPPPDITAVLEVDFRTLNPIGTWAEGFEFDCTAILTSGGRTYIDRFVQGLGGDPARLMPP